MIKWKDSIEGNLVACESLRPMDGNEEDKNCWNENVGPVWNILEYFDVQWNVLMAKALLVPLISFNS